MPENNKNMLLKNIISKMFMFVSSLIVVFEKKNSNFRTAAFHKENHAELSRTYQEYFSHKKFVSQTKIPLNWMNWTVLVNSSAWKLFYPRLDDLRNVRLISLAYFKQGVSYMLVNSLIRLDLRCSVLQTLTNKREHPLNVPKVVVI